MSTIQLFKRLKPEYQERVDLVQAKPYKLVKWNFKERENLDDELEFDVEEDVARSATLRGIKAYVRLHKLDPAFNYVIKREFIEEFIEGWYPSYDEETIEEI